MNNCDFMPYLVCEKCNGYYKLQDEESPEDFSLCQCGGKLEFTENTHENIQRDDRPKFICSNCMKENEEGIFCSYCGGKLIAVKNGKAVSNINLNESKKIENLSNRVTKKDIRENDISNESENFFDKISWIGILAGSGFFLVSMFLLVILLFSSVYGYKYSNNFSGIIYQFITIIIVSFFIAIISGALASFISKLRNYEYGIINGLIVGLIVSLILGGMVGVYTTVIAMIIWGPLSAAGGAMGIFIKTNMDNGS